MHHRQRPARRMHKRRIVAPQTMVQLARKSGKPRQLSYRGLLVLALNQRTRDCTHWLKTMTGPQNHTLFRADVLIRPKDVVSVSCNCRDQPCGLANQKPRSAQRHPRALFLHRADMNEIARPATVTDLAALVNDGAG